VRDAPPPVAQHGDPKAVGKAADDGDRFVRRSIVHDHDVEIRILLIDQGSQAVSHDGLIVASEDDNGQVG
jgi:hypothetical protein